MATSFDSTQPSFDTVLPRVSDFQRRMRMAAPGNDSTPGSTLNSTLDRSLLLDLQRFEAQASSKGLEVLEVVAAAVRHARPLRLLLQHEDIVLPLTVMPVERVVHAPLPLSQWGLLRWSALKVLQVEPAAASGELTNESHLAPLGVVLWALALHGSRAELLPEIAGPVAYRMAPGADLSSLSLGGPLASAMARLRRQSTPLHEISHWPGLDRERAMRLLNGLYLQAGLIVSRAHPAAAAGAAAVGAAGRADGAR